MRSESTVAHRSCSTTTQMRRLPAIGRCRCPDSCHREHRVRVCDSRCHSLFVRYSMLRYEDSTRRADACAAALDHASRTSAEATSALPVVAPAPARAAEDRGDPVGGGRGHREDRGRDREPSDAEEGHDAGAADPRPSGPPHPLQADRDRRDSGGVGGACPWRVGRSADGRIADKAVRLGAAIPSGVTLQDYERRMASSTWTKLHDRESARRTRSTRYRASRRRRARSTTDDVGRRQAASVGRDDHCLHSAPCHRGRAAIRACTQFLALLAPVSSTAVLSQPHADGEPRIKSTLTQLQAASGSAAVARRADAIARALVAARQRALRAKRTLSGSASDEGRADVRPPHRRTPRHPRRGRRMTPPGGAWNEAGQSEDARRRAAREARLHLRAARDARRRARQPARRRPRRPPRSRAPAPEPVALRRQPAQGRARDHQRAGHEPDRGQRSAPHRPHLRHRAGAGPRRRAQEPAGPLLRLRQRREQRLRRHAPVQGEGRQEARHPGRGLLRERHSARHHRGQEPDARRRLEARSARPVRPLPGAVGQVRRAWRAAVLSHHAVPHRDLRAGRGVRHRRDAGALLPALEARAPAHGCRGGEARRQRHTEPAGHHARRAARAREPARHRPQLRRVRARSGQRQGDQEGAALPAVRRGEQGGRARGQRRRTRRPRRRGVGTRRAAASRSPCSGSRSSSGATRGTRTRRS